MKIFRYALLLSLFIVAFNNAHAQQRKLLVTFTQPFPDTIATNQTAIAYISVKNIDTGAYNGSYTIGYTINGSSQLTPNSFSGIEHDSEFQTILPGDSIQDTLTIHPTGPFFSTGPSVVVIWPIRIVGDSIEIIDTTTFDIEIKPVIGVGIHDPEFGHMYYSTGRLFYQNDTEIRLKQVRIMDARGAIVMDVPAMNEQYLDIPKLPPGMYIVEAILSNNRHLTFKFIPLLH